ncbi:MAG TPA: MmgE/PrpD family protein, partial [Syntrophomonas sp.]|nr:MmgE/PrpD family protein [Syntrophomonas sp.]
MDATYLFAQNFKNIQFEDLSANVVEITKLQVLDYFAVALGGTSQAGVKELVELAVDWGGAPQSHILVYGHKLPVPNAAQINATIAHTLDFDDVHETAIMHPGVVAIPTALTLAEYLGGISGKEFITAVALGTDFICRLGLATRPGESIIPYGWHQTSLYGYITAAAVAGRLLGLSEEEIVNAIGIAYHQSAGNAQCVKDGALTKRLGPGFAVKAGITSALMAQKGITGARNVLEGDAGFYKVYHDNKYSREALVGELGTRFEGKDVTIKPYPCCRGIHPFVDATLKIVKEHRVAAENVDK